MKMNNHFLGQGCVIVNFVVLISDHCLSFNAALLANVPKVFQSKIVKPNIRLLVQKV